MWNNIAQWISQSPKVVCDMLFRTRRWVDALLEPVWKFENVILRPDVWWTAFLCPTSMISHHLRRKRTSKKAFMWVKMIGSPRSMMPFYWVEIGFYNLCLNNKHYINGRLNKAINEMSKVLQSVLNVVYLRKRIYLFI